MQALVARLRTIWYKLNLFDIEKMSQFLNPAPSVNLAY
jgi:hypothetical protein